MAVERETMGWSSAGPSSRVRVSSINSWKEAPRTVGLRRRHRRCGRARLGNMGEYKVSAGEVVAGIAQRQSRSRRAV